jgi:HTH-type transcriptional regulator/antitoxin HipB
MSPNAYIHVSAEHRQPQIASATMWVITPTDIAQVVREQRKNLGLSQQELARRAGVTRQWIGMLEKGKPTVELASVLKVLAILGLRLDIRDRRHSAAVEAMPPLPGPGTEAAGGTPQRRLATTTRPSRRGTPAPASPAA